MCARHDESLLALSSELTVKVRDRLTSIEDVRLTALAFVELKDRLGDGCPSREKWSV